MSNEIQNNKKIRSNWGRKGLADQLQKIQESIENLSICSGFYQNNGFIKNNNTLEKGKTNKILENQHSELRAESLGNILKPVKPVKSKNLETGVKNKKPQNVKIVIGKDIVVTGSPRNNRGDNTTYPVQSCHHIALRKFVTNNNHINRYSNKKPVEKCCLHKYSNLCNRHVCKRVADVCCSCGKKKNEENAFQNKSCNEKSVDKCCAINTQQKCVKFKFTKEQISEKINQSYRNNQYLCRNLKQNIAKHDELYAKKYGERKIKTNKDQEKKDESKNTVYCVIKNPCSAAQKSQWKAKCGQSDINNKQTVCKTDMSDEIRKSPRGKLNLIRKTNNKTKCNSKLNLLEKETQTDSSTSFQLKGTFFDSLFNLLKKQNEKPYCRRKHSYTIIDGKKLEESETQDVQTNLKDCLFKNFFLSKPPTETYITSNLKNTNIYEESEVLNNRSILNLASKESYITNSMKNRTEVNVYAKEENVNQPKLIPARSNDTYVFNNSCFPELKKSLTYETVCDKHEKFISKVNFNIPKESKVLIKKKSNSLNPKKETDNPSSGNLSKLSVSKSIFKFFTTKKNSLSNSAVDKQEENFEKKFNLNLLMSKTDINVSTTDTFDKEKFSCTKNVFPTPTIKENVSNKNISVSENKESNEKNNVDGCKNKNEDTNKINYYTNNNNNKKKFINKNIMWVKRINYENRKKKELESQNVDKKQNKKPANNKKNIDFNIDDITNNDEVNATCQKIDPLQQLKKKNLIEKNYAFSEPDKQTEFKINENDNKPYPETIQRKQIQRCFKSNYVTGQILLPQTYNKLHTEVCLTKTIIPKSDSESSNLKFNCYVLDNVKNKTNFDSGCKSIQYLESDIGARADLSASSEHKCLDFDKNGNELKKISISSSFYKCSDSNKDLDGLKKILNINTKNNKGNLKNGQINMENKNIPRENKSKQNLKRWEPLNISNKNIKHKYKSNLNLISEEGISTDDKKIQEENDNKCKLKQEELSNAYDNKVLHKTQKRQNFKEEDNNDTINKMSLHVCQSEHTLKASGKSNKNETKLFKKNEITSTLQINEVKETPKTFSDSNEKILTNDVKLVTEENNLKNSKHNVMDKCLKNANTVRKDPIRKNSNSLRPKQTNKLFNNLPKARRNPSFAVKNGPKSFKLKKNTAADLKITKARAKEFGLNPNDKNKITLNDNKPIIPIDDGKEDIKELNENKNLVLNSKDNCGILLKSVDDIKNTLSGYTQISIISRKCFKPSNDSLCWKGIKYHNTNVEEDSQDDATEKKKGILHWLRSWF